MRTGCRGGESITKILVLTDVFLASSLVLIEFLLSHNGAMLVSRAVVAIAR